MSVCLFLSVSLLVVCLRVAWWWGDGIPRESGCCVVFVVFIGGDLNVNNFWKKKLFFLLVCYKKIVFLQGILLA